MFSGCLSGSIQNLGKEVNVTYPNVHFQIMSEFPANIKECGQEAGAAESHTPDSYVSTIISSFASQSLDSLTAMTHARHESTSLQFTGHR